MGLYQKKPVVIEARLWDGSPEAGADIFNWLNDYKVGVSLRPEVMLIDTLEGEMTAQVGDWIIKGVAGEFYPCKPEIFMASYEAVE